MWRSWRRPGVVALCEEVSVKAIAGRLPANETSVGMRVQLDHLHPSAIGSVITAEATLEKVEGRPTHLHRDREGRLRPHRRGQGDACCSSSTEPGSWRSKR